MKRTSPMTKQEIIDAIANEYEKVKNDLDSRRDDRNLGRYVALMDLLQAVTIYEE